MKDPSFGTAVQSKREGKKAKKDGDGWSCNVFSCFTSHPLASVNRAVSAVGVL